MQTIFNANLHFYAGKKRFSQLHVFSLNLKNVTELIPRQINRKTNRLKQSDRQTEDTERQKTDSQKIIIIIIIIISIRSILQGLDALTR